MYSKINELVVYQLFFPHSPVLCFTFAMLYLMMEEQCTDG